MTARWLPEIEEVVGAEHCCRCNQYVPADEAVMTDDGDHICRDCIDPGCPVCGKVGGDHVACTRAIEAGVD